MLTSKKIKQKHFTLYNFDLNIYRGPIMQLPVPLHKPESKIILLVLCWACLVLSGNKLFLASLFKPAAL